MLEENLCQKTYLNMDLYSNHEHIKILANAQGEPMSENLFKYGFIF